MTEHPGVVSTLSRKLYGSVEAAARTVIFLSVITGWMIITGYLAGSEAFLYAISSVAGLGVYMSILPTEEEGTTIEDLTDSLALQVVLSVLLFSYFNAVVFISMVLGLAMHQLGYPAIALIVGALYPVYDLEIAKVRAPLSIAGAFMISLALCATLLEILERLVNAEYAQELLSDIASLRERSAENIEHLLQGASLFFSSGHRPW